MSLSSELPVCWGNQTFRVTVTMLTIKQRTTALGAQEGRSRHVRIHSKCNLGRQGRRPWGSPQSRKLPSLIPVLQSLAGAHSTVLTSAHIDHGQRPGSLTTCCSCPWAMAPFPLPTPSDTANPDTALKPTSHTTCLILCVLRKPTCCQQLWPHQPPGASSGQGPPPTQARNPSA